MVNMLSAVFQYTYVNEEFDITSRVQPPSAIRTIISCQIKGNGSRYIHIILEVFRIIHDKYNGENTSMSHCMRGS